MTSTFLVKGAVIGFSLAAPVGPIGLLCIRRSLAEGRVVGLVTGLGAATADASYGAIAAFGLTAVSAFLVSQKMWLGLFGGVFLCYLGVRVFTAAPASTAAKTAHGGGLAGAYASTFVLTLTNPMTILSFIPVFAGLGLGLAPDAAAAASVVAGVFLGSALWWLLLSNGVALLFRHRVDETWMRSVNRVSGAMIFAFGLYALASALGVSWK
jgi:threonine/homoserine/homoserine lactone efflux protein